MVTLIVLQLGACTLAAWFYVAARPGLLERYRIGATPLPASAALALSSWLIPTLCVLSVALTAAGLGSKQSHARRMLWVASGLTLIGLGFAAAALAALAPSLLG